MKRRKATNSRGVEYRICRERDESDSACRECVHGELHRASVHCADGPCAECVHVCEVSR
jgi:hypothetical protein